ncbi:peptidylprolyl isomerase [Fluviispira multicolorata]|uniref:Peptidyl-prolyl cis-trans isomerase n=1 Tax=Fluviispira multicolorata TaxID=2654512 RepID=A0A833N418_9BACT|nr:peptidylprolyl isomerase [Fluviispira multicolorata]KAB8029806.1 peptidylprolyl isomerase A [Fluviispira multicolorata]
MKYKLKILLLCLSLPIWLNSLSVFSQVEKTQGIKSEKKKKKLIAQKNQTPPKPTVPKGNVEVVIVTSMGEIKLDLFKQKDPITVNNFLNYVKSSYYNNTIFHRVIDGFIIQGGAYDVNFTEKENKLAPIKNMSSLGLKNTTGTIAMARKPNSADSATSQFFINLANNNTLDCKDNQDGYTVFGKVISGMEVVQKIAKIKIGQREGMYNVPFYPKEALIQTVSIKESQ